MTTRFTTLCRCLFVLAVAACGDDGGNNSGDTCGDGNRTGTEQCDDGNINNGDGCSATCRNESSGPVCGDGVISGNEECDDTNTMSGDGCSSTCMNEGEPELCGNGVIDGDEECDDDNSIANDGCTACNVDDGWTCNDAEPSACTMTVAPNGSCTAPFTVTLAANADGDLEGHAIGNTTGGTDHFPMASCNGDTDAGGGNDHTYRFTLASAADVMIVGPEVPGFDLVLRLSSESCSATMMIPDDVGGDGCSDDDPELLYYVNLPAGTYYLTVDGYDNLEAGMYDVEIVAYTTFCGDGELDIGEECDDDNTTGTDGCSDRCDVEPGYTCDGEPSVCELSCGNGVIDQGEECDDAGSADTDGCSSTCMLEYDVLEAENNNVTPQAITATNHIIKGSLDEDDVDLYTFTLTAPARIEIETYVTIDASLPYGGVGNEAYDCDDGADALADTVVNIFAQGVDVTMNDLALVGDDDDGDSLCSYVGANDSDEDDGGDVADPTQGMLPAGTYTIKVVDFDGIAVPRYLLDFRVIQPAAAGSLAINEYLANDGTVDSNCDTMGTTTSDTTDEFVEIVNKSTTAVDLTGVTIEDGSTTTPVRHTFGPTNMGPGSMILDPGKAVVIWAGGEPDCAGVTNWFLASSGQLGLNNSGAESITVKAAGGAVIATVAFTATTAGVSNNLDVDITGTTYMLHNAVTGHVGDLTPGMRVNNTPF